MWDKIKAYIKQGNNNQLEEIKYEVNLQDKKVIEEISKKITKLERSYSLTKFTIKTENFLSECCQGIGDQSAAVSLLFWSVPPSSFVDYYSQPRNTYKNYRQNDYLEIKERIKRIKEIKQIIKRNTNELLNIQEKRNACGY